MTGAEFREAIINHYTNSTNMVLYEQRKQENSDNENVIQEV